MFFFSRTCSTIASVHGRASSRAVLATASVFGHSCSHSSCAGSAQVKRIVRMVPNIVSLRGNVCSLSSVSLFGCYRQAVPRPTKRREGKSRLSAKRANADGSY